MSPRSVELALKKQRLQLKSAILRDAFAYQASSWAPAFAAADRVQAGIRWLRRHPALPIAVLVALLVARPRAMLRLAGRGWLVWRGLRRVRGALVTALAMLPGARS
jgi:hypothetical protein